MSTELEVYNNNKDKTIISFSGIGSDSGAIPPIEFKSLIENYNVIYVIDTKRSWYNSIDSQKIIDNIPKKTQVITIGNSMGAFNACCFTNEYPVDICIMFATQFSIRKDIVPFETRWRIYANRIKEWKYPHLKFNNTTEYFIIQGSHSIESKHTDLIKDAPNIHKHFFKSKHKVARKLKQLGILKSTVVNIIEHKKLYL